MFQFSIQKVIQETLLLYGRYKLRHTSLTVVKVLKHCFYSTNQPINFLKKKFPFLNFQKKKREKREKFFLEDMIEINSYNNINNDIHPLINNINQQLKCISWYYFLFSSLFSLIFSLIFFSLF